MVLPEALLTADGRRRHPHRHDRRHAPRHRPGWHPPPVGRHGLRAHRRAISDLTANPATEIVFVTGRPPMFLSGFAEMTGHRGTVIAANGALVLGLEDLEPDIIHAISPATVTEVISRVARATEGAEFPHHARASVTWFRPAHLHT